MNKQHPRNSPIFSMLRVAESCTLRHTVSQGRFILLRDNRYPGATHVMRFTDRSIAALKSKTARYEVWEDGRTGFGVRVAPSGRRSWVYMYRFAGRPRRMTLGTYPEVSLADARVANAKAKQKLARGVDPGSESVAARRAERSAETVAELIDEYLEKHARPKKRSAAEDERCLMKDVHPRWGNRKAKHITRRDVIVLLDRIVDRGSPIMANRLLAVVRRMFAFAVDRDIIEVNPCLGVKEPGKETRRDRVLSEAEIKAFWAGLDKAGMTDQVRLALRFLLVSAQRRGEVIEAQWSEFDLPNTLWTIAAERSKNGVAHAVPLSPLAMDLLATIRAVGGESRWLFPSPKGGDRPIIRTSVNHALHVNDDVDGLGDFTPHDLRRSAASHMTALRISRLTVSKILNHTDRGVTAIYDRHSYLPEKRHALDAWGARLQEIVSAEPAASNVVSLGTAGDAQ